MVGSHKILTVSYGTFSCTLEGFDDAFGTMRAIAEYFRDLAAEDRYFGAEPPTPDAEMLQRIAEREIARRVEARMDATGLVLRAEPAAPVPAPAPAHAPVAAAVGGAVVGAVVGAVAGAVARSLGAQPVAAPEAVEAGAVEAGAVEAGAMPAEAAVPVAGGAPAADPEPPTAPPTAALMAAPMAPPPDAAAMPPAAPRPELPAHPDADSVAAKLQRIRAVVGRGAVEAAEDDGTGAAILAEMLDGPAPGLAADAADRARVDAEPGMGPDLTVAATPEPVTPAQVTPALVTPAPVTPVRPRVIRMRRAEFDEAVAEGAVEPVAVAPTMGGAQAPTAFAPAGEPAAEPDVGAAPRGLSAEDEADLLAELAAVEAERAAPAAAPDARGAAGGATTAPEAAPVMAGMDARDGVAADEARPDPALAVGSLMASLDPAPADMAAPGATKGAAEPDAAHGAAHDRSEAVAAFEPAADAGDADPRAADEQAASRALLAASPDGDEAAMARILSQTDAELADPEAARRREAIAQLKAAVAATEAARRLGEPAPEPGLDAGSREGAFRDDLAQVVRPRRPVPAAEARAERPRPAPLKLVASQRVDVERPMAPASSAPQPVRPRRVTVDARAAAEESQDGSQEAGRARSGAAPFAAFAAEMGAHSLTDILEAAAAYLSHVEGAEDFSRPQVIDKVRQVAADRYTREDGLRSFGTLLRQGTIARARSGRFQLSGDSRFNPARRAG